MDVRLDVEQRALRDSVVQLVDRLAPGSVADLQDTERQAKLDAAVAASGWRELRAADEGGAPWASAVEVAIVAEELGRGLVDTSFIGPTLAADLRRLAGAPETTAPETVAMMTDLSGPARDDDAVVIDTAGSRTALIVTDGGTALATIDVDGDGDTGVDLTRPIRRVASSGTIAMVAGANPLSRADLTRYMAFGLALSCADLVGVMRGTITLASDYAGVRQQYGALIGSFQAVQHLLADAFVSMEGSRSVALHAAWAVDALSPDEALVAAATAKAYCARAARAVCEASIQVHGGIGNTWECLAHVFLRRALVSADLFGGVGPNLDRVLAHQGMGSADGVR
jgi:alkylation response protein AidB-like acyl-CoA dehydrogenase